SKFLFVSNFCLCRLYYKTQWQGEQHSPFWHETLLVRDCRLWHWMCEQRIARVGVISINQVLFVLCVFVSSILSFVLVVTLLIVNLICGDHRSTFCNKIIFLLQPDFNTNIFIKFL